MLKGRWVSEDRKYLLCADSYDEGVLKGRLYNPLQTVDAFSSLSQFLVKLEQMLEESQTPQAFNVPRTFSPGMMPEGTDEYESFRGGVLGTFELRIIFRQNTSWQGILIWRDKKMEHSFRSVLELVLLLDSALRPQERSGCA